MRRQTCFGLALVLALAAAGCGASSSSRSTATEPPSPQTSEPDPAVADTPRPAPEPTAASGATATDPSHLADPPVLLPPEQPAVSGRDLSTVPGAAEHNGECCTSSRTCGGLTCARSHYATCARMCLIACRAGDLCPPLGGTPGGHRECPDDGLCPVSPPGA